MPILEVKLYIYQLFRSLAYIHSQGICHRDIKPQNLLLDPNTGILKLCDFGSAKILVENEPNVSYICSRYYRSPELIFGATNYTTKIGKLQQLCPLCLNLSPSHPQITCAMVFSDIFLQTCGRPDVLWRNWCSVNPSSLANRALTNWWRSSRFLGLPPVIKFEPWTRITWNTSSRRSSHIPSTRWETCIYYDRCMPIIWNGLKHWHATKLKRSSGKLLLKR